VTTSGFDFKGIVEPELRVPVFYCKHTRCRSIASSAKTAESDHILLCLFAVLSQNHSCASAEADALLRTLDLASFILKKPFDVEDACSLWRDVAWRKCSLRRKTAGDVRPLQRARSSDDDGLEKERVHFRIVIGGGKKRKDRPRNSSGSSIAAPGSPKHTKICLVNNLYSSSILVEKNLTRYLLRFLLPLSKHDAEAAHEKTRSRRRRAWQGRRRAVWLR
jgi:hypothetical protein